MDILTHALSGVAVATCSLAFAPAKLKTRVGILLTGLVGGALPDIDAISLWSRFDGTLGKLFGLSAKGSQIYGAKFWYSYHAFFHSLLASLLLGVLLMLLLFLFSKKKQSFLAYIKAHSVYFITFILAFWAHLAGDLPTPSSVWGGIRFFWPSLDYVGGSGKIWWWNNYDIFLLIVLCILVNTLILLFTKKLRERVKKLVVVSFCFFLVAIVIQVNTRQYDYAYTQDNSKYQQMEQNSKMEQKRILGDKLYNVMEAFDKKLKFYF